MNWLHLMRMAIVAAIFVLGWMMRTITIPLLAAYLLMLICLPWRQKWKRKVGSTAATLLSMLTLLFLPMVLFLPALAEVDDLADMIPDHANSEEWKEKYILPLFEFENEAVALEAENPASGDDESTANTDVDAEAAIDAPPTADLQPTADVEASGNLGEQASAEGDFTSMSFSQILEKIKTSDSLTNIVKQLALFFKEIGGTIVVFFGGVVGILSSLLLLPIFLFYLLEGAPWLPRIRCEIPKSWQPAFDRTLPKIQNLLRVYCRARLLVALIKGAIAWVILLIFGVTGAYTLGLMVAVFSLLPVVGALVSTCAIIIFCLVEHQGLGLVLAISVYVITELVEGYILLPRLVGRELGMSDFVVILAVLGGGALMGFFGLLIAIPAVAIGKVLYDEHVRPLMKDPEDSPDAEEALTP